MVCVQLRNLHWYANDSSSENVFERSVLSAPISLMPGVSITTPPRGHKNISRPVVVWRPLSPLAISCVAIVFTPSKRLINVDLPTPEEPIKAQV